MVEDLSPGSQQGISPHMFQMLFPHMFQMLFSKIKRGSSHHLDDLSLLSTTIIIFGAYTEKEDSKKLKQKQREHMQPKMGEMDIDFQVFHDAFFKYQTKPKLTAYGDLYHEGKEFEVKLREIKAGNLSHNLKEAFGMPDGAPPLWLINMQRYGPPPSYPQLKIPGLNAPIPPRASFGYHPGGWASLQSMNMGVLCMEMFLEFNSKNSPTMMRNQSIRPSIPLRLSFVDA